MSNRSGSSASLQTTCLFFCQDLSTLVSSDIRLINAISIGRLYALVASRLQITRNCDSHFRSLVLDWTIRSSPNFLKTGLDCGLGVPDRTVWSFLQSLFPSDKKDRTVRSSLIEARPDCGLGVPDRTVQSFSTVYKKGHGPDRTRPWPV